MVRIDRKKERVIAAIREIKKFGRPFPVDSFIENYNQWGSFTPKQLYAVFSEFKTCGIEYDPQDFKLSLKSKTLQDQFLEMTDPQGDIIYPAFSKSQMKWYIEYIGGANE